MEAGERGELALMWRGGSHFPAVPCQKVRDKASFVQTHASAAAITLLRRGAAPTKAEHPPPTALVDSRVTQGAKTY